MSRCRALHYDDDTYVELGPDAPLLYRDYDYGSTIPVVWTEIAALGKELGAGDLDRFVCPEATYRAVEEIEEEIEEAEEEEEPERVAELRAALASRLPTHDPNEILVVVRAVVEQLEREPESRLAELALVDLRGYEIALRHAAREGRRVFLTPY